MLITANYANEIASLFGVFSFEKISTAVTTVALNRGIGRSPNAWMNFEYFYEYTTNVFYQFLIESKILTRIVFIINGHENYFECAGWRILLIELHSYYVSSLTFVIRCS